MDSKTLMQEHGEKLALAGAGLILAVYVVMGWVLWAPSDVYTNTDSLMKQAQTNLAMDKKPELPALPTEEQVRSQWKVNESLGNAQKGLEWVAYVRPKAVAELIEGPTVEAIPLYPPKISEPTVDIGKVNLSWEGDERTKAEVKNYVVLRKSGSGGWEEIVTLEGSEKSYADDKTSPKTTYSYKVKAIAADVPKVTHDMGDTSGEVSIATPDTTSIRFVGGTEQMAQIEVQKFMNGKWEIQKANVRPNDPIGKKETRMVDRKPATLDFQTGYQLIAISKEPRVTKVKKMRNAWKDDPNQPGKKIQVEEEYEETTTVTTLKITYKDDAGAEKEMWMEPPKDKK